MGGLSEFDFRSNRFPIQEVDFMRFSSSLVLLALLCGCVDSPAKQSEPSVPTAPALPKSSNADYSKPGPADPDAPTEFTETGTGLKYRVLRKTDGKKPIATDKVYACYKGTLDNGKEFDSSYSKGGQPIEFGLNQVIPGWTEGLQYCPVGGMIELEIPAELAYGDRNMGDIPPGSRLHFIVELIEIR